MWWPVNNPWACVSGVVRRPRDTRHTPTHMPTTTSSQKLSPPIKTQTHAEPATAAPCCHGSLRQHRSSLAGMRRGTAGSGCCLSPHLLCHHHSHRPPAALKNLCPAAATDWRASTQTLLASLSALPQWWTGLGVAVGQAVDTFSAPCAAAGQCHKPAWHVFLLLKPQHQRVLTSLKASCADAGCHALCVVTSVMWPLRH